MSTKIYLASAVGLIIIAGTFLQLLHAPLVHWFVTGAGITFLSYAIAARK